MSPSPALGYLTVDDTIDTSSGSGGVLTATGVVFHAAPILGTGDISLSGLNHAPSLDLDADNSSSHSTGICNEDHGGPYQGVGHHGD